MEKENINETGNIGNEEKTINGVVVKKEKKENGLSALVVGENLMQMFVLFASNQSDIYKNVEDINLLDGVEISGCVIPSKTNPNFCFLNNIKEIKKMSNINIKTIKNVRDLAQNKDKPVFVKGKILSSRIHVYSAENDETEKTLINIKVDVGSETPITVIVRRSGSEPAKINEIENLPSGTEILAFGMCRSNPQKDMYKNVYEIHACDIYPTGKIFFVDVNDLEKNIEKVLMKKEINPKTGNIKDYYSFSGSFVVANTIEKENNEGGINIAMYLRGENQTLPVTLNIPISKLEQYNDEIIFNPNVVEIQNGAAKFNNYVSIDPSGPDLYEINRFVKRAIGYYVSDDIMLVDNFEVINNENSVVFCLNKEKNIQIIIDKNKNIDEESNKKGTKRYCAKLIIDPEVIERYTPMENGKEAVERTFKVVLTNDGEYLIHNMTISILPIFPKIKLHRLPSSKIYSVIEKSVAGMSALALELGKSLYSLEIQRVVSIVPQIKNTNIKYLFVKMNGKICNNDETIITKANVFIPYLWNVLNLPVEELDVLLEKINALESNENLLNVLVERINNEIEKRKTNGECVQLSVKNVIKKEETYGPEGEVIPPVAFVSLI